MSYHHLHYPSPSPFSNATLSPVRHGAAISVRPLSFQVYYARWRQILSFVSSRFSKNTRSQPEELHQRLFTQVSLLRRAWFRPELQDHIQKKLTAEVSVKWRQPAFSESVGNKNQYKQGTRLNCLTLNSLLHWTESRETTKKKKKRPIQKTWKSVFTEVNRNLVLFCVFYGVHLISFYQIWE